MYRKNMLYTQQVKNYFFWGKVILFSRERRWRIFRSLCMVQAVLDAYVEVLFNNHIENLFHIVKRITKERISPLDPKPFMMRLKYFSCLSWFIVYVGFSFLHYSTLSFTVDNVHWSSTIAYRNWSWIGTFLQAMEHNLLQLMPLPKNIALDGKREFVWIIYTCVPIVGSLR